jgi:hypothetical protein
MIMNILHGHFGSFKVVVSSSCIKFYEGLAFLHGIGTAAVYQFHPTIIKSGTGSRSSFWYRMKHLQKNLSNRTIPERGKEHVVGCIV